MNPAFTFQDILIKPHAVSRVESRQHVSTKWITKGLELEMPIMTASMAMFDTKSPIDATPTLDFARAIGQAGGMHIFSRALSLEDRVGAAKKMQAEGFETGIAVSLNEFLENDLHKHKFVISIDIANGAIIPPIKWFETKPLIVGNYAAPEIQTQIGSRFQGNIITKMGVGSGSACSTRVATGIGYPQAQLIADTTKSKKTQVISDGGKNDTSDVIKALALGADAVMTGRLFGGCTETPWPSVTHEGVRYKPYRGMASKEQKGSSNHIEGVSGHVPENGSVASVMKDLRDGLTSAMSYTDTMILEDFPKNANIIYAPSHNIESKTRV